jgi:hypothetical protein
MGMPGTRPQEDKNNDVVQKDVVQKDVVRRDVVMDMEKAGKIAKKAEARQGGLSTEEEMPRRRGRALRLQVPTFNAAGQTGQGRGQQRAPARPDTPPAVQKQQKAEPPAARQPMPSAEPQKPPTPRKAQEESEGDGLTLGQVEKSSPVPQSTLAQPTPEKRPSRALEQTIQQSADESQRQLDKAQPEPATQRVLFVFRVVGPEAPTAAARSVDAAESAPSAEPPVKAKQ